MITRLRLINYRNHRDTEITLEPLTVFIGPVASGKSNVFNALGQLAALVRRVPAEAFGRGGLSFESVRWRGARPDDPIGFEVGLVGPGASEWREREVYALQLVRDPDGQYRVAAERYEDHRLSPGLPLFERERDGTVLRSGVLAGQARPQEPPILHAAWRSTRSDPDDIGRGNAWPAPLPQELTGATWVAEHLAAHRTTRLTPEALATPAVESERPAIDPTGMGLANALAGTKGAFAAEYGALMRNVQGFEPRARDIAIEPVLGEKVTWGLVHEDGNTFWAEELSDGTLLAVGLAAVAMIARAQPGTRVCVEEPETGVHPRLLNRLLDMFVELAYPTDGTPPVQVLMSTHSPYLLDFFKDMPQCVRVLDLEDGVSKVTPLAERIEGLGTTREDFEDVPLGEAWAMGLIGGV